MCDHKVMKIKRFSVIEIENKIIKIFGVLTLRVVIKSSFSLSTLFSVCRSFKTFFSLPLILQTNKLECFALTNSYSQE
jgi:hypothetical protein